MNGLREKLLRFMKGRYGADQLFFYLAGIYLVLVFVNIFLRFWSIHVLGLVIFAIAVLRSLSRNTEKRRRENEWVMTRINKLRAGSARSRRMREQSGDYYFKKCPGCKKTLRLPRIEGRHSTRCPSCGETFEVNIKPARKRSKGE